MAGAGIEPACCGGSGAVGVSARTGIASVSAKLLEHAIHNAIGGATNAAA